MAGFRICGGILPRGSDKGRENEQDIVAILAKRFGRLFLFPVMKSGRWMNRNQNRLSSASLIAMASLWMKSARDSALTGLLVIRAHGGVRLGQLATHNTGRFILWPPRQTIHYIRRKRQQTCLSISSLNSALDFFSVPSIPD